MKADKPILTIDMGGTKTLLALAPMLVPLPPDQNHTLPQRPALQEVKRYENRHFSSPAGVITAYLNETGASPRGIALAIAAPVSPNAPVKMMNLPWQTGAKELTAEFGAPVHILNDLEACAYSTPLLPAESLAILHPGKPPALTPELKSAWIAPGTGLGESFCIATQTSLVVVASEGGQCDFSAQSDRELELLKYLKKNEGFREFISWETVLSGAGLERIYRFFLDQDNMKTTAPPAKKIPELAKRTEGSSGCARKTIELFLQLLGRESANLALRTMAKGGVYLFGGILPLIDPSLLSPLVESFRQKRPMKDFLESVPLYLVTDPQAPLLGAWLAFGKHVLKNSRK